MPISTTNAVSKVSDALRVAIEEYIRRKVPQAYRDLHVRSVRRKTDDSDAMDDCYFIKTNLTRCTTHATACSPLFVANRHGLYQRCSCCRDAKRYAWTDPKLQLKLFPSFEVLRRQQRPNSELERCESFLLVINEKIRRSNRQHDSKT